MPTRFRHVPWRPMRALLLCAVVAVGTSLVLPGTAAAEPVAAPQLSRVNNSLDAGTATLHIDNYDDSLSDRYPPTPYSAVVDGCTGSPAVTVDNGLLRIDVTNLTTSMRAILTVTLQASGYEAGVAKYAVDVDADSAITLTPGVVDCAGHVEDNGPTPQPPNEPTELAATAQDGAVGLRWKAPATDGSHDEATGYDIEYSTAADFGSISSTTASISPATVTGLTNGTRYYFRVAARNDTGPSGWAGGGSVSATPMAPGSPSTFGTVTRTATGFTVPLTAPTGYDPSTTTFAVSSGTATISADTLSVTNLTNGGSSTIGVTVADHAHTVSEAATVTGQALFTGTTPTFGDLTRTAGGFTTSIDNWTTFTATGGHGSGPSGHNATYLDTETHVTASVTSGTVTCGTASGTSNVPCDGSGITVTGLANGADATVTISVTDDEKNHTDSPAGTVTGQALFTGTDPLFGAVTRTDDGFTTSIGNWTTFKTAIGNHTAANGNGAVYYSNETTVTASVDNGATVTCGTAGPSTSVTCDGSGITVTGLDDGADATVTIGVTDGLKNHTDSSSSVNGDGQSLYTGATPEFGAVTRTATGFRVPISNYQTYRDTGHDAGSTHNDSRYDVSETHVVATVTDASTGIALTDVTPTIDTATGLLTVTGLIDGQRATITVTVDDIPSGQVYGHNHTTVHADIQGQALWIGTVPAFATPTRTDDGFRTSITNFDAAATYQVSGGAGSVSRSGSSITVTGLSPEASATVTVTVSKAGYTPRTASVTGQALATGIAPTFAAPVQTESGFTAAITNFDAKARYAATAAGVSASAGAGSVRASGMAPKGSATVTVTVTKDGFTPASAAISFTLPADAGDAQDPAGGATPPNAPEQQPGAATVILEGLGVPTSVTVSGTGITVAGAGSVLHINATVAGRAALPDGTILVLPADCVVNIDVSGYAPGSRVQVWAFSTPALLGTFTVDQAARGAIAVRLPAGIETGSHTLVVRGSDAQGREKIMSAGVRVVPAVGSAGSDGEPGHYSASATAPGAPGGRPGDAGYLSYTGLEVRREVYLAILLLLLGAGMTVLGSTRRNPFGWPLPMRLALASGPAGGDGPGSGAVQVDVSTGGAPAAGVVLDHAVMEGAAPEKTSLEGTVLEGAVLEGTVAESTALEGAAIPAQRASDGAPVTQLVPEAPVAPVAVIDPASTPRWILARELTPEQEAFEVQWLNLTIALGTARKR